MDADQALAMLAIVRAYNAGEIDRWQAFHILRTFIGGDWAYADEVLDGTPVPRGDYPYGPPPDPPPPVPRGGEADG